MSEMRGRTIELWVEERVGQPAVNPIMRELLDGLATDGAQVVVRVPEWQISDPDALLGEPPPDLVLLKTATTLGLSLAVAGERNGGSFLNRAAASLRANDKPAVVARLAAAGLPVPDTWLVNALGHVDSAPIHSATGWVVKPARGVHGQGVELHEHFPSAIGRIDAGAATTGWVVDDGVRMVQTRIGADEPDIKVYVAGERCCAGAKAFGRDSFQQDEISARPLDAAVEEVVRAAGALLGLRCFGVDLRFSDGQPVIIDVNPFPGYRGFREVVPALRHEIERALDGAAR